MYYVDLVDFTLFYMTMSLQGSDSQLSKGNTETQWSEVSNNKRSKTFVLCRFLIRRHLLWHVLFPTMGRQIMTVIKHLPLGITDLSITNHQRKVLIEYTARHQKISKHPGSGS